MTHKMNGQSRGESVLGRGNNMYEAFMEEKRLAYSRNRRPRYLKIVIKGECAKE